MLNRKTVLYIKFKNFYMNETDACFEKALKQAFNVIMLGPGYTKFNSKMTLTDQLNQILSSISIDAVFVDQYIIQYLLHGPHFFSPGNIADFEFNTQHFTKNEQDFARAVLDVPQTKFLVGLRTDPYSLQDTKVFDVFDGYFLIFAYQSVAPISQIPDLFLEQLPAPPTDIYIDYCNKNQDRIIQVSHIIDDAYTPNISNKKYITVSGCPYYWRRKVSQELKDHPNFFTMSFIHKLALASRKYPKPLTISKFLNSIYQQEFIKAIERSYLSITDGSRLRCMVRKFFEIPYYQALLLCEPFHDHENFGFLDGINFLKAQNSIAKQVDDIMSNYQDYMPVVQAGATLIKENFSVRAYSQIIAKVINLILSGQRLKRTRWIQGKYHCEFEENNDIILNTTKG